MKRGVSAIVPEGLRHKLRDVIRRSVPLNANAVVRSLYTPVSLHPAEGGGAGGGQKLVWSRSPRSAGPMASDGLPVPPPDLRMGYTDDADDFIQTGARTAAMLRALLAREGVTLGLGTRALEWGCASGRVIRHFRAEAQACEFWGIDQDDPHLDWAKQNLAPPFHFVGCTALPHLPFADGAFQFVYGISVFTHLVHLIDMWLMEFRRILAPGGLAVFTVHDEHTLGYFREHPEHCPDWLAGEDLGAAQTDDVVVYRTSDDWGHIFTHFRGEWLRDEWGRYLEFVSLEPRAEGYQTAVVLRKG
jgi:SAM-dependent methyltransferase